VAQCIQYDSSSLLNYLSKCQEILCWIELLLDTLYNNVYIYCRFVFSFELSIMGFINIYFKEIYLKPFICTIKCINHVGLKVCWVRT